MSFSKRLEDFVTCPLCVGLFSHPVQLPCQHTFCQLCVRDVVQRLWQSSYMECPVCRTGCSIQNIKDDSRAQSLLEIYEESRQEEQDQQDKKNHTEPPGMEPYTPHCELCPVYNDTEDVCEKCSNASDDCTCTFEEEMRSVEEPDQMEVKQPMSKEDRSSPMEEEQEEVRSYKNEEEVGVQKQEEAMSGKEEVEEKARRREEEVKPNKQEEEMRSSKQVEEVSPQKQEVPGKQEEEEKAHKVEEEVRSHKQEKEMRSLKQVEEVSPPKKEGKVMSRKLEQEEKERQKEEARAQLKDLIAQVQELHDEADRRHQLNQDMITQIEQQEKEQIAQVRQLQKEELERVDEHHIQLIGAIVSKHRGVQKHLETGNKLYRNAGALLQEKIQKVTAASNTRNIRQLDACLEELSPKGMADIDIMRAEIARYNDEIGPPELSIERPEWNPSTSTRLEEDPLLSGIWSFQGMVGRTYTVEKCVDLTWSCYAEKMVLINDQLWCAAYDDGIYVYDKDCVQLKKIRSPEISKARGVTKTDKGEVIVACDESIGLLRFNPDGSYRCALSPGSFCDVAFASDTIYALEYEKCQVFAYTFRKKTNKWVQSRTYALGYLCDTWDRLVVARDRLYLSSITRNMVFMYHLDGRRAEEFAKVGHDATKARCPLLCDTDSNGQLLMCDYATQELLVYTAQENWQAITVDGEIQLPMGAVVDKNEWTVYVVTRNKQIMKLCKE